MLPDPHGSRAVLVGASGYEHHADLPAVANNIATLARLFVDPLVWGIPAENCSVLMDPSSPQEVLEALWSAAQQATDALVFYFAGHGLVQPDSNNLYLALRDADLDRLFRAIRYDEIRELVASDDNRPMAKVVLLDCCYSGMAMVGGMGGGTEIGEHVRIDGSYLMTATAETVQALAPLDESLTAFTGELVNAIEAGISDGPEFLDLETLYWHVRNELANKRRPIPQQRARNSGRVVALARNRRHHKFKGRTGAAGWSDSEGIEFPAGYESAVNVRPRELLDILSRLEAGGDEVKVEAILRATGVRRAEQGVAAVVAQLQSVGRSLDADTVLSAASRRDPMSVVQLLEALRETRQSMKSHALVVSAAAGPPDRIAALAALLARHDSESIQVPVLIDASLDHRAGHPAAIITMVGALLANGLQEQVQSMLDRLGEQLPQEDLVALADALREAGRETAAYELYRHTQDLLAERPIAGVVALAAGMYEAGRGSQTRSLLDAIVTVRPQSTDVVELLDALWSVRLVDEADRVLRRVARFLNDEGLLDVVEALHVRNRAQQARSLLLTACDRRSVDAIARLITSLRDAGLPLEANRLIEKTASRGYDDLTTLVNALSDDGDHDGAERALIAAIRQDPTTCAILLSEQPQNVKFWQALSGMTVDHIIATSVEVAVLNPDLVREVIDLLPLNADDNLVATALKAHVPRHPSALLPFLALGDTRLTYALRRLEGIFQIPESLFVSVHRGQWGPASELVDGLLRLAAPPSRQTILAGIAVLPVEEVLAIFFAMSDPMRRTEGMVARFWEMLDVLIAKGEFETQLAVVWQLAASGETPAAEYLSRGISTSTNPFAIFAAAEELDRYGHREIAFALLSTKFVYDSLDGPPLEAFRLAIADAFARTGKLSDRCEPWPVATDDALQARTRVGLPEDDDIYYVIVGDEQPKGPLLVFSDSRLWYHCKERFRSRTHSLDYLTLPNVPEMETEADDVVVQQASSSLRFSTRGTGVSPEQLVALLSMIEEIVRQFSAIKDD